MEQKPIDVLFELIKKVDKMLPFKGKAMIAKNIQGSLDLMRRYKPDPKIDALLLKERMKEYEAGVKAMDEKYKDKEVKGAESYD